MRPVGVTGQFFLASMKQRSPVDNLIRVAHTRARGSLRSRDFSESRKIQSDVVRGLGIYLDLGKYSGRLVSWPPGLCSPILEGTMPNLPKTPAYRLQARRPHDRSIRTSIAPDRRIRTSSFSAKSRTARIALLSTVAHLGTRGQPAVDIERCCIPKEALTRLALTYETAVVRETLVDLF
jgi:hypothetical protein